MAATLLERSMRGGGRLRDANSSPELLLHEQHHQVAKNNKACMQVRWSHMYAMYVSQLTNDGTEGTDEGDIAAWSVGPCCTRRLPSKLIQN